MSTKMVTEDPSGQNEKNKKEKVRWPGIRTDKKPEKIAGRRGRRRIRFRFAGVDSL